MSENLNLERIAYIDELTGLKNKNSLISEYGERDLQNQHFIYVDIDDFKKMNAVFGIEAVDNMLVQVAGTLKDYCGKSDVFRVGAGQFLLVTESHIMCEPSELQRILRQPVELKELQILVNASICVLDHDDFPQSSLKGAMKLMQLTLDVAKQKGNNSLVFADNSTRELYIEKKEIALNLYNGVKNNEFYPKYQPFMDTYTHEIIGFESVARWNLNGKSLTPVCFLEAAEWTGLIYDIEMCIFRQAVEYLRELKDDKTVKISKRFKGAVHLSGYTLKRMEIKELLDVLQDNKISQKDIIIETKEHYIVDVEAYKKIKELHEAGFLVALDDFSNNNASLTFLADLKVDIIELSETLLEKIDNDQEYSKMMNVYKFMVDLSKKFDITVVSTGINSSQNEKLIKDLGVHIGTGKHYSRAIVSEDFTTYLKTKKSKR